MLSMLNQLMQRGDEAQPVYKRIAEALRGLILAGELPCGDKLPPEAELSGQLGVNHQTLRKSMRILAEQKLITQCRGRGTFISYRREEQRLKIGVICQSSPDDIYFMRMITGLNRALSGRYHGELVFIDATHPAGLLQNLHQNECDAVISISGTEKMSKLLCRTEFSHFPMVFINSPYVGLEKYGRYAVRMASGAVTAAFDHLYGLGHRRIGFISCELESCQLQRLNQEFSAACRDLKIEETWSRIGKASPDWYRFARDAARELCQAAVRPSAVICPGFTFACGAWQGMMEAGLKIPDDMSLIGFDANECANPLMSAMMQARDAVCAKAIELIFGMQSAGKHMAQKTYEFPAELHENGSCMRLDI